MDDVRIQVSSSTHEFNNFENLFDSTKPESLELKTGATITFLTDVTLSHPIVISKKCTIDLNSHYLFIPIASGVTIKNGAHVTCINGMIQSLANTLVEDSIVVQGSKTILTLGENLQVSTHGTAIHVRRRGSLLINDAQICSTSTQPTVYIEDEVSSCILNSGQIVSQESSAFSVRNSGLLEIHDGTVHTYAAEHIDTPEYNRSAVAVSGQDTKFCCYDGHVIAENTPAIIVQDASTVQILGGELYSYSSTYPAVYVENNASSFLINGGAVYSTGTYACVSNLMNHGDTHSIQMIDGKFGAPDTLILTGGPGDHNIQLSGGKVKGYVPRTYLPQGYTLSDTPDEDGYYSIVVANDQDTDVSAYLDMSEVIPILPDISNVNFEDATLHETSSDVDTSFNLNHYAPPDVPEFVPAPVPSSYFVSNQSECTIAGSLNIKIPLYIYRTPSKLRVMTEWKGALRVLCSYHTDTDGTKFAQVKFRIPGSGDVVSGYAIIDDLLSHS